jgi:hypothetical protein
VSWRGIEDAAHMTAASVTSAGKKSMSEIRPVSPDRHGALRWRRPTDLRYAAGNALVPLSAPEIGQATLAFALAFVQREDHWTLSAVLGLLPQQNLYIDGNGRWLGRYLPAALRGYPFLIGASADGQATLCIDEACGLLTEGGDGERFFDEANTLSQTLTQVGTFLLETAQGEVALLDACDKLHEAGIIEPWPITLQGQDGEHAVVGLHRINEAKMNALDDAAFGLLRRSGALAVAYAQILSTGNLNQLGQLVQARAQAEAAERAKAEVKPMLNLPADNTIDWDWSKIGR